MGMGTSWAFPALASVKTIRQEEQEILFCAFYWFQLDGPVKKASTDVNSLCLRFSILGQFRWEESEEAEAVKSKGAGKSKTGPSDSREVLCTEVDPEPSPRAERRETRVWSLTPREKSCLCPWSQCQKSARSPIAFLFHHLKDQNIFQIWGLMEELLCKV